jgi:hypothetical protein
MSFQSGIQDVWSSDYVQKNPNKSYKNQYSAEYLEVAAYINGGSEPDFSGFSRMGRGLCEIEKQRRLVEQPEPGPGPEPEPEPSPISGLRFPAAGHKWGGNEQQAIMTHDLVMASTTSQCDPRTARANNPGLIALMSPAFDPFNSDWTKRKAFAFTYGGGFQSFTGATDSLQPYPQGTLRPFASSDLGCKQDMDGLQGFALHRPETAELMLKSCWYTWKLGKAVERGFNGMWSDNLVPGNLKAAGWFYGSDHESCSGTPAAWDTGLVKIGDGLRDFGVPIVGGNFIHRATNNAVRACHNGSEHETLQDTIAQGPNAYAQLLSDLAGWRSALSGPSYLLVIDIAPQSDAARLRFGLALACIAEGAYFPNSSWNAHQSLYQPAEMNPRGRLGRPVAPYTRSGNTFSRQFEHGSVSANFDTKTVTGFS